jgi:hypothetical protein
LSFRCGELLLGALGLSASFPCAVAVDAVIPAVGDPLDVCVASVIKGREGRSQRWGDPVSEARRLDGHPQVDVGRAGGGRKKQATGAAA